MMDTAEAGVEQKEQEQMQEPGGRMPAVRRLSAAEQGALRRVCENLLTRSSARLDQMRFSVSINLSGRAASNELHN